ncbi:hypothetical protein GCM10023213_14170 [Prosthecobacter algae]|uniref:D-alanyl-D-alanine carboxypeptidase-like protein n=1 Tax=Prosthecobacter algae TaxID=1144682 RepID=A0ABP9NYX7_9BACT
MKTQDIINMQRKIGATPDGFWGPQSIAKLAAYLRKLMPKVNPWPKPNQAALTAFYGKPGDESRLVNLNVTGLGVKYEGKAVKTIRCHERVAESLYRVIVDLSKTHPQILAKFDGCYNDRPMRTSSLPSLHARGAATDWNQAQNGLKMHWPTVAVMPLEVMEAFAREGWKSLGALIARDAMHFEATS